MTLTYAGNLRLVGTVARNEFDEPAKVTGTISEVVPHEVHLVAHDFNDEKEQHYTGHLATGSGRAIAGVTAWRGTPFGFFAVRTASLVLPSFRAGAVQPADLTGSYSVFLDGEPGTLFLGDVAGNRLEGVCRFRSRPGELSVTAEVGVGVPHGVTLSIGADGDEWTVTAYLFSRPKNAVAGTAERLARPSAFYMFRFR